MGSSEIARALVRMTEDPAVIDRMAGGDFSDLPDGSLTEAEEAMVSAAAADMPEVDGFFLRPGDVATDAGAPNRRLQAGPGPESALRHAGLTMGLTAQIDG